MKVENPQVSLEPGRADGSRVTAALRVVAGPDCEWTISGLDAIEWLEAQDPQTTFSGSQTLRLSAGFNPGDVRRASVTVTPAEGSPIKVDIVQKAGDCRFEVAIPRDEFTSRQGIMSSM